MRYLGEDYDLNTAYNGHGKMFLQDEYLRDVEPMQYVEYRVIAYTVFIISLLSSFISNLISIKKTKEE
jgi:hypothetical protein